MTDIVYARDSLYRPHSDTRPYIFLAGPTYRAPLREKSWRWEALKLLDGFDGGAYVPENKDVAQIFDEKDYEKQVAWELQALSLATVVLFWVPRDMKYLPGMTTNVEFGWMLGQSDPYRAAPIVLGFPEGAPHMRYMSELARRFDIGVFHTLEETVNAAVNLAKEDLARKMQTR